MISSLWFRSVCVKNGLRISDEQLQKLEKFISLLLRANRSVNLVSRSDEGNIWQNHILHSISPLFRLSFGSIRTVLDLGTGGGLPGVPLKILLPSLHVTLLDSIKKKTDAVGEIIGQLGITNVRVVCARAEELKGSDFELAFDVVLSRAVAPLKKLVRWSAPLVRKVSGTERAQTSNRNKVTIQPGSLVAFKGGDLTREIGEVQRLRKAQSVREIPLVFHGSEELSLVDKKLILVEF